MSRGVLRLSSSAHGESATFAPLVSVPITHISHDARNTTRGRAVRSPEGGSSSGRRRERPVSVPAFAVRAAAVWPDFCTEPLAASPRCAQFHDLTLRGTAAA